MRKEKQKKMCYALNVLCIGHVTIYFFSFFEIYSHLSSGPGT